LGVGIVEGHLGWLNYREGNLDSAIEHLRTALVIAQKVGNRWREAWTERRLGIIFDARGQVEEAAEHTDNARKIFQAIGCREQ
jgi:Flp pilus assembly protein TadD